MEEEKNQLSWFQRNFNVQTIVANSLLAALYAVITIACGSLSYIGGSLQLRFSEILNLLVFFNPTYTLGLTIGCLLANIVSIYTVYDVIFGTLGTLVSSLLIVLVSKTIKNLLLCSFVPCFINAFIVPFIVYLSTIDMEMNSIIYFAYFGWTFLGEFVCIVCVGYPLFLLLSKKYKDFNSLIRTTQNHTYLF